MRFDQDQDSAGPITIGVALNREINSQADIAKNGADKAKDAQTPDEQAQEPAGQTQNKQQRVVVIGDGDFLSNTYLGNGANIELGLHIVNWLSHDDRFISVPSKTTPDVQLELSLAAQLTIALGFLIFLPLTFAGAGVMVWLARRKR